MHSEEEVQLELQRVLASDFFRGSKRSRAFLTYVVESTLSGSVDQLKERTLGVEVFGRDPSYDTGDDAIVRVKANEIRKRLAQYAASADPERPVTIELPSGSYVPQFQWRETHQPEAPSRRHPVWKKWYLIFPGASFALAAFVFALTQTPSPLKQFWTPILKGASPPIICLGQPGVYVAVNGESHGASPGTGTEEKMKQVSVPARDRNAPGSLDVVRVNDSFVGFGDSDASFLIGRTLRAFGKSGQARLADSVSFSDLKRGPSVLVGGFSNRWTMSLTNHLRFSFAEKNGRRYVIDRDHPAVTWRVPSLTETGKASEDYAIVSRLLAPSSGQATICVAGISNYGSQAAGEFITDPSLLHQMVRIAPPDWEHMNLQLVLKIKVVDETPTTPRIVAAYFWR